MSKKELISSLYIILCLYEDMKNPQKPTDEKDYMTYLKRQYLAFSGMERQEISYLINGLKKAGIEIEHDELKTIVFHMIGLINKEGD